MATPTLIHRVTVIDQFRVTPPSGSVPETHLPLTFFDVLWHPSVTVQRIFFFDLPKPYTKSHFLTTQLSTIKQSLSLALQRFYPLAATLTPAPQTGHNEFHYTDGDPLLSVAGSPRLQVHDVDFGFGRPRKVEVISIEESGAMSLAESREDGGRGIEVGLALPESEMERVTYLFKEGLGIH
ncbi:hypothetical protein AAC387_Pa01g0100 [Persea americana]